jgi:hypothetical protein
MGRREVNNDIDGVSGRGAGLRLAAGVVVNPD